MLVYKDAEQEDDVAMDSGDEESSDEEIKEIPIGGANKRRKGADSQDEDSMLGYGEEGEDSMYGSEDEDDQKLKAKRNKKKQAAENEDEDDLDYGSDDSMDEEDYSQEAKKRERLGASSSEERHVNRRVCRFG